MALTAKLNHVTQGLSRLLSKEKDSTVLRGILQSYLTRIQELEDTAWDVMESRTLDGVGAQLDMLGRFLVAPRGELSDDNYKIALRARIRILRSSGLPRDLIDVTRLSLPTGFSHTYEEAYPKTSIITVVGGVDFDIDVLWRNLLRTKPGGTKLYLIYDDEDAEDVWLFADDVAETDDDDRSDSVALDDEDDETGPGGLLSSVIAA